MVGMLDAIKTELKKEPYTLHGQEVSSRLEMSPKRKPLAKAHALFYKASRKSAEMNLNSMFFMGKFWISFFVGGAMAAEFFSEREGLAGEGWNIISEVITRICTEFSEALFEAVANSN